MGLDIILYSPKSIFSVDLCLCCDTHFPWKGRQAYNKPGYTGEHTMLDNKCKYKFNHNKFKKLTNTNAKYKMTKWEIRKQNKRSISTQRGMYHSLPVKELTGIQQASTLFLTCIAFYLLIICFLFAFACNPLCHGGAPAGTLNDFFWRTIWTIAEIQRIHSVHIWRQSKSLTTHICLFQFLNPWRTSVIINWTCPFTIKRRKKKLCKLYKKSFYGQV